MLTRANLIKFTFGILLIASACGILKKEDPDKDIRTFLSVFEQSLAKADDSAIGYFDARQSKESIATAVNILQNKEHEFIACTALFQNAQVSFEQTGVKVVVPANLSSQNIEGDYHAETTLVMWLKPKEDSFVITKLEAEEFYAKFADIRNSLEWSVDHIREMKKREPIFARAKELQQKFDSVIWFATVEQQHYYYVVEGTWKNYFMDYGSKQVNAGHKMGLVNEQGEVIIPLNYDLIGTLNFERPSFVEVKRDGKSGYFNLTTKQEVVGPAYDIIIPYEKDDAFALVKQDSVYGWLDQQYAYHAGFPSPTAEQWVHDFAYLPKNLRFKSDIQIFCEIPNAENAGYGIVIPPSYLVKSGLFSEIIGGITTTPVPLNGWTDYVETSGTVMQQVTDKINAVITTITERYIEGREEFYSYNRLMLVNSKQDTLAVSSLYTNGSVGFKKIDDTLLEVKHEQENTEGSEFDEYNIPVYLYFSISDNLDVVAQKSNRIFSQSQFVKLDSTYLEGNFIRYTEEGEEKLTFLSMPTVKFMRDEILATYGYRFEDTETADRFKYNDWYKPSYDKVSDFQESMSGIDQHNIAFLEKIMSILQSKPV